MSLRRLLAALLMALTLTGAATASADAAQITRGTKMSCSASTLHVYFPQLRTVSGQEKIYFSPDLYKYTSAGWKLVNSSKPWYFSFVDRFGNKTINGFKWFTGNWPYATGWQNSRYTGLSSGSYAVKGYFYRGSSHWARDYDSGETHCRVS